MNTTHSSRIISLLAYWEKQQEAGKTLSPTELCKDAPELLEQLKAQLQLIQQFEVNAPETATYNPNQTIDQPVSAVASKITAGQVIAGRYRLQQLIGEGGMGSVWMAEQLQPVKRQVALKLILDGRNSSQVIRRFEAERQALALMDHTNIARIYDGGISEWGGPFFVMELVNGVPLTRYCDDHRLNVEQRLKLVVTICQAIQHAHQKGIIHRDLKPGNILVTEVDGKPVPKVIDFGVAKATERQLTEGTLDEIGAIVGTPAYMSPEQADPESVDIDTRTDVYALGIILYELLTGAPPIDSKQFKRGALLEMLRMVREYDPPRLSTRLSSAENLPNIAACRNTEPDKLTKALRGDLDWIVLKALEKDRNHRYPTANGLAADVQRHLEGEAVLAHPPSRWYLIRKFVNRHRGQVLAAGFVAAALLVGLAISLWQMNRAIEAESSAVKEKNEKEEQRIVAVNAAIAEKKALAQSERRLEQIQNGVELISQVFENVNPRTTKKQTRPLLSILGDRLESAAEKIEKDTIGDADAAAYLLDRLGVALLGVGRYDAAIVVLGKSVKQYSELHHQEHRRVLVAKHNYGYALLLAQKFDKAIEVLKQTYDQEAEFLGKNNKLTISTAGLLGQAYQSTGKISEAISILEVLRRNQDGNVEDADRLTTLDILAVAYQQAGRLPEAVQLLESIREQRIKLLTSEHPDTIATSHNLALAYRAIGQPHKAVALLEDAAEKLRKIHGDEHPDTLTTTTSLGLAYRSIGNNNQAIELFEKVHATRKLKSGPDHPDTLATECNLGSAYADTGNVLQAIALLEKTREKCIRVFGNEHNTTLDVSTNLALAYQRTGKVEVALKLHEEVKTTREKHDGPEHPATLTSLNNLAIAYRNAGQAGKSIPLLRQAAAGIEKLNYRHQNAQRIINNLIIELEREQHYSDAEIWRRKWLSVLRQMGQHQTLEYTGLLVALSQNLFKQSKWPEAETVLNACLSLRQKMAEMPRLANQQSSEPTISRWQLANVQSMLGEALFRQKKYSEAEVLLKQGYTQLHEDREQLPAQAMARLTEALDRLIQFYTVTSNPDEVKKWQAEKAKLPQPALNGK